MRDHGPERVAGLVRHAQVVGGGDELATVFEGHRGRQRDEVEEQRRDERAGERAAERHALGSAGRPKPRGRGRAAGRRGGPPGPLRRARGARRRRAGRRAPGRTGFAAGGTRGAGSLGHVAERLSGATMHTAAAYRVGGQARMPAGPQARARRPLRTTAFIAASRRFPFLHTVFKLADYGREDSAADCGTPWRAALRSGAYRPAKMIDTHHDERRSAMKRAQLNFAVDAVIAVAFLITAVSGILFLLPSGAVRELGLGRPGMLGVSYATWRHLHDWSGVVAVAGVLVHAALHYRWIVTMTRRTFAPAPVASRPTRRRPRGRRRRRATRRRDSRPESRGRAGQTRRPALHAARLRRWRRGGPRRHPARRRIARPARRAHHGRHGERRHERFRDRFERNERATGGTTGTGGTGGTRSGTSGTRRDERSDGRPHPCSDAQLHRHDGSARGGRPVELHRLRALSAGLPRQRLLVGPERPALSGRSAPHSASAAGAASGSAPRAPSRWPPERRRAPTVAPADEAGSEAAGAVLALREHGAGRFDRLPNRACACGRSVRRAARTPPG